jgi:outer membrane protein assembly factor BamA
MLVFIRVLLCCLVGINLSAQISLKIICSDNPNAIKKLKHRSTLISNEDIKQENSTIISQLQLQGYLTVNCDSFVFANQEVVSYFSVGPQYKWTELKIDKKDALIFADAGLNSESYQKQFFTPKDLKKIYTKLLFYLENNGYPFAVIKFDSISIQPNSIGAKLKIEKNKFITLDSIKQEPNQVVSVNFITHYLQIKEGMPFSERKNKEITKKLKQLPFLKENKPPLIKLTDKSTKMYLFLDKKNASQFDGIIGLLPGNNGKTIFTGDVKIKLQNSILKSGELLEINFRRLQAQTQDVFIKVNYPYLFSTPVGTEYAIKIYRKDTSFIDVTNLFNIQYLFNGLNNIKIFYKQRNASIISTAAYENTSVLPEFADMQTISYGVGCFIEQLDYKFNPRKGISFNIQASAGNRKIKQNPRINENAYRNVDLFSAQYQIETYFNSYLPIAKRACLKIGIQAAGIYADNIFKNELFRIGGLKTLRGFDEESIFASTYVIPTIEYRYLFEENSALFLFAEGAWYESTLNNNYVKDTPISFGAGINFETKAGIFSLNYALGKQFSNAVDLRTGKIHFGLINKF